MYKYLFIAILIVYAFSCSGKDAVKPAEKFDAEKSFVTANELIDKKDYEEARAILLEIKNRDLSKKYAPLAQLRIADSYVKEEETDLAIAEYKRFQEIYPDHRHATYAQYQIAMIYFNQIEGPERGYGGAARSILEFEKLKRDFPRNPYKEQIEIRIKKCRNIMADYEFLVGEFYHKKGSYKAAISRYEYLLENFPDYKNVAKVLFNLGISYKKDGQMAKAGKYLNRLIKEYPDSPQVSDATKELASLEADKK